MRAPTTDTRGLSFFAERAAHDIARARRRMLPVVVKRIRTALRRVRAMCEVLLLVDDTPETNALRRDAKRLMRTLGPLRDLHVERALLLELVSQPLPRGLALEIARETARRRADARRAVLAFDIDAFLSRARQVEKMVAPLCNDHPAIVHIAWEQLAACAPLVDEARQHAHEEGPPHALRIGLKRFRYVVENFLPTTHAQVGKSLKERQDLLGEMHDLDVARARFQSRDLTLLPALRRRALARIRSRRTTREKAFLKLVAMDFLHPFFTALPTGAALVDAACARLALKSDAVTHRPATGNRRAALARRIHDAFVHENVLPVSDRDAHLAALAARWVDVRATERESKRTRRTVAALYNHAVLSSLDDAFFDALLDVVRGATRPFARQHVAMRYAQASTTRDRVRVIAAIARLACVLDDGLSGRQLSDVRIEGDTLLVVMHRAQKRLPVKERRAFAHHTRRKLVVAQVFRGERAPTKQGP